MEERVKLALERVKPLLEADGGGVDLVSVENNVIKVHLTGSCCGCPMSTMTLNSFIERRLKEEIPEIERVVAVWLSHPPEKANFEFIEMDWSARHYFHCCRPDLDSCVFQLLTNRGESGQQ
jgi:Fe-S cluster biogenesis protein NfuA